MTTPITPTPTVPTAARPVGRESSHWYYPDGSSCYHVPRATGKGTRATTLADARKMGLLPSVTGILKILHKEALEKWKIEQAVLAVVTAPRLPGEADDAFIYRVLHTEEQHEQEAQVARDRGTEIHDALDFLLGGMQVDPEILPWIAPAATAIQAFGKLVMTESNLVGPGFAGRSDILQEAETHWSLSDFKSAKKLPDPNKGGAWMEHRLQLAAYAKAFTGHEVYTPKPIILRNIYISTINQGEFVICEHEEAWEEVYARGFAPLVKHWQWATGYTPPGMDAERVAPTDQEILTAHKLIEANIQPQAQPSPPRPAPSNGQPGQRRTVVTQGQRVSPAGTPLPLPPPPQRQ